MWIELKIGLILIIVTKAEAEVVVPLSSNTDGSRPENQAKESAHPDSSRIDDSESFSLSSSSSYGEEDNTNLPVSNPYVEITAEQAHYKKVRPCPEKISQPTEEKSTYQEEEVREAESNCPLPHHSDVVTLEQVVPKRLDGPNISNVQDIENQPLCDSDESTQLVSSAKEVESDQNRADTLAKRRTTSVDAAPDLRDELKREEERLSEDEARSNAMQSQEKARVPEEVEIDCTSETMTLESIPLVHFPTPSTELSEDKKLELLDTNSRSDEEKKLLTER